MKTVNLDEIIIYAQAIVDNLKAAKTTLDSLESTMIHLEALGMTDARPTWRDSKYLYLVTPMINGSRRREYIGNNPARITAALDRIDRYNMYQTILKTYSDFVARLRSLGSALEQLEPMSNPRGF